MNTTHRWFHSGAYSLMGHVDFPEIPFSRFGVLLAPPFGWEDVCSYRPLRFLAETLAASGIPVLRYDLPGTGDSSGGPLDPRLLDAWVQSIDDAASELRTATGVTDVAVVGVRLGGLLALCAASRGANVQDLVLWGASATGRTMLRELRAFASMERIEFANGDPSPEQPIEGLEMGGFLIAPETQRALEEIAFTDLPGTRGRRVLLLSRDEMPQDGKLIRALKSAGCEVETAAGSGYAAMMTVPHEAAPPIGTARCIVEFLTRGAGSDAISADNNTSVSDSPDSVTRDTYRAVIRNEGVSIAETIFPIECSEGTLFGVLSEPEPHARPVEWCVLFLNSGSVRHTGPNRMWVEAARRWASRGVASLRLDIAGVGESDGVATPGTEGLYQDRLVDQVELAMDALRSQLGVRKFAAVGLCAGSFWGFQSAARRQDLRAAVLLNPRLFFWDPEVDRRRLLRRTVKGMGQWEDWRRLATGDVPLESIKQVARIALDKITADRTPHRQIPSERMARAWAAIERSQSRITFMFTEGEPLLREMEEEGQMPPASCPNVRCLRIANSGHTFRPLWAQNVVHELIDRELCAAVREQTAEPSFADLADRYGTPEPWLR